LYQNHSRGFLISPYTKIIPRFLIFLIIYFGLVRPIQETLLDDLAVPYLNRSLSGDRDLYVTHHHDDLIIESRNDEFVDTRVGVPFGAYYFLVFILLFNTRWRRMMLLIHIYNILLFIISPILVILLLNGLYWLAPAINAHEISYKAIFLSLGMLTLAKDIKMP